MVVASYVWVNDIRLVSALVPGDVVTVRESITNLYAGEMLKIQQETLPQMSKHQHCQTHPMLLLPVIVIPRCSCRLQEPMLAPLRIHI